MTTWLMPLAIALAILSLLVSIVFLRKTRIYPNRPILFTFILFAVIGVVLLVFILISVYIAERPIIAITWIYAAIALPFTAAWSYYMFIPYLGKRGEVADARRKKLAELKAERVAKKAKFKANNQKR